MDQQELQQKNTAWLVPILVGGCIFSVAISFYFFYIKKDYNFFVEVECDPSSEECFSRDCDSDESDCPPNNYSYYNEYTIQAKDFSLCKNENCTNVCKSGQISCVKKECTDVDREQKICVGPTGASS